MLEYLRLLLQSKVGFTSGVVLWAVIATSAGALAVTFLIFSAYIWVAGLVGPLAAALVLGGIFLVFGILCATLSVVAVRLNIRRANHALAGGETLFAAVRRSAVHAVVQQVKGRKRIRH